MVGLWLLKTNHLSLGTKAVFLLFVTRLKLPATEWIERLRKWSQHLQIYHSELCVKITACQSTYCIAFQV
jgi:hypothetical protein